MPNIKNIFTSVCLLVALSSSVGYSQVSDEISDFVTRINETDKVERLYSIRYGLDKLNESQNLTIADQRSLSNAYLLLANSFRSYNHFRNAVDVYFDYLELKETYRKRYIGFVTDSLKQVNQKITTEETDRIAALDAEITLLQDQQMVVSGMKKKYYTFGSIATIAILLIAALIFINRTKAINGARLQLETNQNELQSIFKLACNSSLMVGSVEHAKFTINENVDLIAEILDFYNQKPITPADKESLKALKSAQDKLMGNKFGS